MKVNNVITYRCTRVQPNNNNKREYERRCKQPSHHLEDPRIKEEGVTTRINFGESYSRLILEYLNIGTGAL